MGRIKIKVTDGTSGSLEVLHAGEPIQGITAVSIPEIAVNTFVTAHLKIEGVDLDINFDTDSPKKLTVYDCGFKSSDNKPCATCPKSMSNLHSCGFLQDELARSEDERV